MIVGFSIPDVGMYEDEAIDFIRKICGLTDDSIPKSIIATKGRANVFPEFMVEEDLHGLPFSVSTIEVNDGDVLLTSAVDFHLEVFTNDSVRKLHATEYFIVPLNEVSSYRPYLERGLLRAFPTGVLDGEDWVISNGFWHDDNEWIDNKRWED